MSSELQSLSLLFQNKIFRIPDYQRGYAWQQSQLVDFWEDLVNLQNERYHYTGMLSLKLLKDAETHTWGEDLWVMEKGFKGYHIVDGQQRLTTIIILLNEIVEFMRNLDDNKAKSDEEIYLGLDNLKEIVEKYICLKKPPLQSITTYLFGYEHGNPSAEFMKHRIFHELNSGSIGESYYTKNLQYAKNFFRENLEILYSSEGIEATVHLYQKLILKMMFNIHEIDDDYDVFIAFETMNNRGKKLTNLELLKNRLIYLTTLFPEETIDEIDKKHLRDQINNAWKEIYYQLGKNEKTPLVDDEFLRAHWITYFTYSRKKGDDYIHFLLNKFNAKNVFEKKTVYLKTTDLINSEANEEDDEIGQSSVEIAKLEPMEIAKYVGSLKELAQYWYDSFYPFQSTNLTENEKIMVDSLNRIGIGHFRPLVMTIISRRDLETNKRIALFQAIERFIFICFRLGSFNASFGSSDYYRATRQVYFKELDLDELIDNIHETTNLNIEYSLPNFVTRIEKHFNSGGGFYYWNGIKYFFYEYEYSLAKKNKIGKVSWEMFTKSEKDKVSIEHILPQTPSKYYWRNQFRQFDTEEIELLSGALGNLLPLSQSVNSALQNDSFDDKKFSKVNGRRGYQNGSHSEIEVAKEDDWTASVIYQRSKVLLNFMENRWQFSFTSEQLEKLIFVSFAKDGRTIPEELPKNEDTSIVSRTINQGNSQSEVLALERLKLWTNFVEYCKSEYREEDIASRKPSSQGWYHIPVIGADYHLEFSVTKGKYISLIIYAKTTEVFLRLESKKEIIENEFGSKLDWYSSKVESNAKRIIYKQEFEIFNPDRQTELFAWMIDKFDLMCHALITVGEMSDEPQQKGKFAALKVYLESLHEIQLTLTFAEIEKIVGEVLSKSAYTYKAYWHPSPTHTMPNIIEGAGYKIISVDLIGNSIRLKRL